VEGGDYNYMNLLLFVILGAIAGWLASVIMRTNSQQGVLMDIVLGIIGAFVGGMVMNLFGAPGATGFDLYSIVVATLGAVLLIALRRMFTGTPYTEG
jgi:uncharacterized membrane protein YeaQ/YmgE (transglycosylase-associated protein family)